MTDLVNRRRLSRAEQAVILKKGTERPFTGEYVHHWGKGMYVCKQCGVPLYLSEHKFEAHCGWPSFDEEISDAVVRVPDADGQRTEIQCGACGAHLGHVFLGERLNATNTRHCVNSVSLLFVPRSTE